jgi:hypothetical protein
MPVCEGRPDGPCPDKRNDRTVHLSQGDLMLCDACEKVRFPCVDNKDRKQAGHATAQRKAADNRSQRLGSEGAASRLMVAPDDVQTTKKADGENVDDSTRFTSATTVTSDVVINELLAYVQFFRNKANGEALKRTVSGFLFGY